MIFPFWLLKCESEIFVHKIFRYGEMHGCGLRARVESILNNSTSFTNSFYDEINLKFFYILLDLIFLFLKISSQLWASKYDHFKVSITVDKTINSTYVAIDCDNSF